MKQLFFILFIIPSLCFGQLGLNKTDPQANLHIIADKNFTPLMINTLENKTLEKSDSFLVIGDNGLVKKVPNNLSNIKNQKFTPYPNCRTITDDNGNSQHLTHDKDFGKGDDNFIFKLKNWHDPEATDSDHNLVLPDTGSFAISLRYFAELNGRSNRKDETYFGNVTLKVTNAKTNEVLDEVIMVWIGSDIQDRITYNIVSEIHGKKGTPIKLELIRQTKGQDTNNNWYVRSGTGCDASAVIAPGLTNLILWKLN